MKKKSFLVICFDEEYVCSIEGSLANNIRNEFELEFITDQRFFDIFLHNDRSADVLLIDEKIVPSLSREKIGAKTYIITESDQVGPNLISKYSGSIGILKQLGGDYVKRNCDECEYKTKIHDVVCIGNPALKTYAALGVSMQLSKYGRKVLYLCAENLQDFKQYMDDATNKEVKCATTAIALKGIINGESRDIEAITINDSFDYIEQFDHFLSAYGITEKNMYSLAEKIQQFDIYDDIVLEHSYGFSIDSLARLEKSRSVVICAKQDSHTYDYLEKIYKNTREIESNSIVISFEKDCEDIEISNEFNKRDNLCEKIRVFDVTKKIEELSDSKLFRSTAEALL